MISSFFIAACGNSKNLKADTENERASDAPKDSDKSSNVIIDKIGVYYFHGTHRCATCKGIQKNIEDVIEQNFMKESFDGSLDFKSLNMDLKENKHYVKEFNLSFGSMVVASLSNGKIIRWKNCSKVWELNQSPEKLKEYVKTEITNVLKNIGQ
ncbi:MAG: hypothetical protein JXR91_00970 [Deltaproteobacteria bacterium]|nr:hypothetical protein [Deltaproteobacteria bacterium]